MLHPTNNIKIPNEMVSPQIWHPSSNMLNRFKILNYEHERMDFVGHLLKNAVTYTYESCKNDDAAITYRKKGNEMFLNKNYSLALKLYNESIARAKPRSALLGLAYGNRSALLYRKKFYKECLEDIGRALQTNYPEDVKQKLLKRQEEAKHFLPNQVLIEYHASIPSIKNRNPYIQVAADSINLRKRDDLEQDIVVATSDIKAGDLLVIEKPYATEVYVEHRHLHCYECLELCINMIPCDKCTVLFCSELCKQEAIASYHKYECVLLQKGIQGNIFNKVILKSGMDFKKVNENTENENIYRSDRIHEILKCRSCPEKVDIKVLWTRTVEVCVIYNCLKEDTDFLQQLDIKEDVAKEFFYKLFMITEYNCIVIDERDKDPLITEMLMSHIGVGIYPFRKKIRHACSSNTVASFYGSYLVIRALCNIKMGEEIYNTCGATYIYDDLPTRQKLISNADFPKCTCRPCTENWPVLPYLPEGPKLPDTFMLTVGRHFFQEGNISDERALNVFIAEAVKLYHSLKKYEPSQNFVIVSQSIRLAFGLTGNKIFNFR